MCSSDLVRSAAYATDSAQQILRLTSAIENYKTDYGAYPGPLSNDQVITAGGAMPAGITGKVTMSENLVLGLIGGLKPGGSTSNPAAYDEARIRSRLGPMSLNPLSPKGGRTYFDASGAELAFGANYQSEYGGPKADDSNVPEIVDHFPDSMPVLYYRARAGAPGVVSSGGRGAGAFQYDIQQNIGYLKPRSGASGIGGSGPHGLVDLGSPDQINTLNAPVAPWLGPLKGPVDSAKGVKPYDAISYFMNQQLTPATPAPTNATGVARQKDGYILISPGKDRVYGTTDDITNFGGVQ